MITKPVFYGGARYASVAATFDLKYQTGRVQTINPTAGGVVAKLQSALQLKQMRVGTGGPIFIVINVSSSHSVTIHDDGDSLITVIPINEVGVFCLLDNSTADGAWAHDNYPIVGYG